jgi:uncharacterized membrane protein YphA (DoxX/SURF4 family)
MASVALAARLVVAAALIVAGIQKLRARRALRPQVAAFGVPTGAAPVVAVGLPLVELAAGAALLIFLGSSIPAWVALAILALFTGAVAANLATGREVPCPCFGTAVTAVSPATLARNGWLVALAVIGTASTSGASVGPAVVWTIAFGLVTVVVLRTLD